MYNSYKRQSSRPINIDSSPSDRNDGNCPINNSHGGGAGGRRIGSSSASVAIQNPNYNDDYDDDDNYDSIRQSRAVGSHRIDHHHAFASSNIPLMMEDEINSSTNQLLTVGSLPSSRRERRFLVSHGKQERLHDSSSNVQSHYSMRTLGSRHGHGAIGGGAYDLSRSMPVPRAPFLASRKDGDVGERLSRIPNMTLPESVTECSQASSVPYGSLNESQFRLPWTSSSSFVEKTHTKNAASSSYNPSTTTTSSSTSGHILDIRKKFQQMRMEGSLIKNDQGGLASLFGRNNEGASSSQRNDHDSSPSLPTASSSSLSKIHLDSSLSQTSIPGQKQDESKKSPVGKPSLSSTGGIGSLLGQESHSSQSSSSSPPPQRQQQQQQQQQQQEMDHNLHERDDTRHGSFSGTTMLQHTNTPQEKFNMSSSSSLQQKEEGVQLSASLTGLSILKTSPRGMVDLDPEDREAIASMRSRSHSSGDGNGFVLRTTTTMRKPSDMGNGGEETESTMPNVPVASLRSSLETLNGKLMMRRFSSGSEDHSPLMVGGEGNGSGENESDEFFNLDM